MDVESRKYTKMGKKTKVSIAVTSFSQSPGPRYWTQGEASGEKYYHEVLNKAFVEAYDKKATLEIILDGADGYASSFLDETIGNLVFDFGEKLVKDTVVFVSKEEPEWIDMLLNDTIPQWEKRRKNKKSPRVTVKHPAWFRITDNNTLESKIWETVK